MTYVNENRLEDPVVCDPCHLKATLTSSIRYNCHFCKKPITTDPLKVSEKRLEDGDPYVFIRAHISCIIDRMKQKYIADKRYFVASYFKLDDFLKEQYFVVYDDEAKDDEWKNKVVFNDLMGQKVIKNFDNAVRQYKKSG
jgi:hypothetical protein